MDNGTTYLLGLQLVSKPGFETTGWGLIETKWFPVVSKPMETGFELK